VSPLLHSEHPELQHPEVTRPCKGKKPDGTTCGHQVSRYRWEGLGVRTCSLCEEGRGKSAAREAWLAGIAEQKRRRAEESRQRGEAMGTPHKLAGKGPAIVQMHDVEGRSFISIALAFGCSDVAVRACYQKHKAILGATQEPAPVKVYKREAEKAADNISAKVTPEPASEVSTTISWVNPEGDGQSDYTILGLTKVFQLSEPAHGWCMEHAMPVVSGEACPHILPGFESCGCGTDCMDWRNERPVVYLGEPGLEEAKAELLAAVDEQIAEMEPEPPASPVPFAGMATRPITLYYYSDASKVATPPADPAMDALMRLVASVPMTADHRDLITIAHELGDARGEARGLARGRAEVSD
jgi:hypothetical protein